MAVVTILEGFAVASLMKRDGKGLEPEWRYPGAGREHVFRAWRLHGSDAEPVAMRNIRAESLTLEADDETTEE
jgi:hypothetical protein